MGKLIKESREGYTFIERKFCPFIRKACMEKQCSCYVELWKPHPNFSDQYYTFSGCGLITHPTWNLKKEKTIKGKRTNET